MTSDPGQDGPPLVSIVTSCHDRAAFAERSLRSLLEQTYRHIEVVCVDDGSTDGSGEILERIVDPRLRLVRQKNVAHYGKVLNAAIAMTRGSLIAIHDFGDVSHPQRIARQVETMRTRPDVGVVGCWVRRTDLGTGESLVLRHRRKGSFAEAMLDGVSPFTHGETMYRRALFERVGGYRDFFKFAQDRDLFTRLSRLCDYHVVEEELYEQFLFANSVSVTPEKLVLQAYFSETARQCGARVAHGEPDLVDLHGLYAGFFVKPSARVADRLARFAIQALAADRLAEARRLSAVAVAERRTPLSVAAATTIRLADSAFGRAFATPALKAARRLWTRRRAPSAAPAPGR